MPNYFDAREILAERWRNRRSKRIPWVPGQRLGLPVDEDMPDTVRLDPALRPETHEDLPSDAA